VALSHRGDARERAIASEEKHRFSVSQEHGLTVDNLAMVANLAAERPNHDLGLIDVASQQVLYEDAGFGDDSAPAAVSFPVTFRVERGAHDTAVAGVGELLDGPRTRDACQGRTGCQGERGASCAKGGGG